MAMPRPRGEAYRIAEMVVPGLSKHKKKKRTLKSSEPRASMSEVEIMETNNIENKKGLR